MSSYSLTALQDDNERLESDSQTNLSELFVQMPEKSGVVVIRLLPPADKKLFGHSNLFFQKTRLHYLDNRSWHCPKELVKLGPNKHRWQGDCVICDYYNKLWEESKKPDCSPERAKQLQNSAREIKPVERNYWNCIVRKEIDPKTNEVHENVGPKIFSVGVKMHRFILRAIFGDKELEEEGLGDVFSPTHGRDLKIIKSMVKGGDGQYYANYDQSKFLDVTPLGTPDQIELWTSKVHDLSKLRNVQPKEELEKQMSKYLGNDVDDTPDEGPNSPASYKTEDLEDKLVSSGVESISNNSQEKDSSESLAEDDFMKKIENL